MSDWDSDPGCKAINDYAQSGVAWAVQWKLTPAIALHVSALRQAWKQLFQQSAHSTSNELGDNSSPNDRVWGVGLECKT